MKLKTNHSKAPADPLVKDIRRATRRHYSTEDKRRIVLSGPRGMRIVLMSCTARKVLRRGFTLVGEKSF
jgi:transposase